jgi:FkbM family methyltransferase
MKQLLRLISSIWRHPLNSSSLSARLAAVSRMLRWQLAVRILPESLHALPFVNGSVLMATRGAVGVTGNWYSGLDEPAEMGFLLHLLGPGDLFIDIGANVGSFTVLACSVPGVRAIAYEPIPETAFRLRRNILVNDFVDVAELRMLGLSDAADTLRFTQNQDSMNHVVAPDEANLPGLVEIKVARLDDELADLPPGQPLVLKIDVEGHEFNVIAGARNVLSRDATLAVIMETNGSGQRYGVSEETIFSDMTSLGFEPCIYDIETRELIAIARALPDHQNTIFVKNLAVVRSKLKSAAPFVVHSLPV